jgi:ATP-dependent Clp protease protease subunit
VLIHPTRLDDEETPEQPETEKTEPAKTQPGPFQAVQQALFKSRTILIFGEINQKVAQDTVAQLLAYAAIGDEDITIVINSPGGHVESGDSIHDTIRFIKPRVKILGTGWVASAGAHIFLGAKRENRIDAAAARPTSPSRRRRSSRCAAASMRSSPAKPASRWRGWNWTRIRTTG